jgi:hypothetical protein
VTAPPSRFFWVMERTLDGAPAYWDGGHAESFTRNIHTAVQWCRKDDLLKCVGFTKHYAQWGWIPVEHGIIASRTDQPVPSPAAQEPEITCPACGGIVRQTASATLSLALWQHWNWACESSPPVADSPTWLPIKSAPKDGTEVLVWDGDERYVAKFTGSINHFCWRYQTYVAMSPEPTHWMPLPSAPSASAAASQERGAESGMRQDDSGNTVWEPL